MTRTLLVIDVQNEYFPGGLLPLWQAEGTEVRIVTAIRRARAAGDRVILVQHLSSAGSGLFAAGSVGAEIRAAIRDAAPDAPIVTKAFADAFQGTDLAGYLGATDTLVIGGMMTQNCVVFTALSSSAAQLTVKVDADLCTAPSEIVHKIALNALGSKGLLVTG